MTIVWADNIQYVHIHNLRMGQGDMLEVWPLLSGTGRNFLQYGDCINNSHLLTRLKRISATHNSTEV